MVLGTGLFLLIVCEKKILQDESFDEYFMFQLSLVDVSQLNSYKVVKNE